MAYRVSLSALAETDAYAAFERIREAAPLHAEKWLTGLFEAIFSLNEMPARCPIILEAKELGYPARQLLFGKGKAFTGSSLTSARTTSMCVYCVCGILHSMPLQPPMWRTKRQSRLLSHPQRDSRTRFHAIPC
jgi:hypothetical protein